MIIFLSHCLEWWVGAPGIYHSDKLDVAYYHLDTLGHLQLNFRKLRSWIQPHPSWQIEGEKVEAVTDFFISVSKTTVDAACSHEIRGRLLLGRKAMRNINSVLRSRNIILPKKLVDIWAFHLDSSTFCPVPIGLWSPLAFWSFTTPKIILCISLPSPEISHLFKNPCIIWWETYLEATW